MQDEASLRQQTVSWRRKNPRTCTNLQEFPAIRFRAAKPSGDDPVLEARALAAQRVAIDIHDRLLALQKAGIVSHTGELVVPL